MTEDDERDRRESGTGAPRAEDNSLGRLLALSDGIFAIAMTLLTLDLTVPQDISDASLGHYLAEHADSYWSYALTFFVIAGYWSRHRRLMRSVVESHPALVRDTLILLFVVAAMPFPASLLGRYGSEPIALALYGGFNAVATITLIVMSADVKRLELADGRLAGDVDYAHRRSTWLSLFVFLLCIPAGYVLGHHGPWVLVLLAIPAVRIVGRTRRVVPWQSVCRKLRPKAGPHP